MNAVLSSANVELDAGLQRKVEATRALLLRAVEDFGDVVYSNSLGAESIVLTDLIWSADLPIEVFSVDTGRLHEETYTLLERIQRRYGKRMRVYYPDAATLEEYVSQNGINGFYNGLGERQSCCHIRKVAPFRRAVAGRKAWITGVRREQSATRSQGQAIEWDTANSLYRVSPLLDWTHEDIWAYIRAYQLPYNPLHDRHYPSIGCSPCTRAIGPGEDSRAGRWWWENPESRECGLLPRIRVVTQATG